MKKSTGKTPLVLLVIIALFTSASFAEEVQSGDLPLATWKAQWDIDPMDFSVTCKLFSDSLYFMGTHGSHSVNIGIQDSGIVTLHTIEDAFDSRYITKFGIRAGRNKAVLHPEYVSTHSVRFSPEQSEIIIDNLFKSSNFSLQVSFFPEDRIVNGRFMINQDIAPFKMAFRSYESCKSIKDSDSWLGIDFQDMNMEPSYIKFLQNNSDFSNPGVIIWSLHPLKTGMKSGLKAYDIILAINDKPVDMKSLSAILTDMKSQDSVKFHILRGKDLKKIQVKKP